MRDEVEGLHNCLEFSQPLECLYQAMQVQENSFLSLLKIDFPKKKKNKICCLGHWLKEKFLKLSVFLFVVVSVLYRICILFSIYVLVKQL